MRNLITGKILDRNWQASDYFEEAEVVKDEATFIYAHRDDYWFHWGSDPKNRFSLSAEVLGDQRQFLKAGIKVSALKFKDKIIKIALPIKMDFKVTEAPPAIRGNTAQGGNKVVEIEGGAKITAPLFIETDDIIKINTETGQYVERVEKA
jgi:elongation factor P